MLIHSMRQRRKWRRRWNLNSGLFGKFAACPVVFMYRHALELQLKALVLGDGSYFLPNEPDRLSVYKTHSVSWLARLVSQIVTALRWENEFSCEGIKTLTDFKAVIDNINSVDPGPQPFRYPANAEARADSVPSTSTFNVREFAQTMDALLALLDSTSDALAATWDQQSQAALKAALDDFNDIKPTIQ